MNSHLAADDSALSAVQAFNPQEPIPGYHVEARLGAGGYGEVWRAIAPGQLPKAIKIVYGYRDDRRAARELAALNRIKAVRHPFLLSLERIELVDGHLVIVTELADSSLRNLFDECRAADTPGIPRETLLLHLRDVADALDYINQEHSLQHMDVKPENLLLVGRRVKVADFGLVKDLEDVRCSALGGLTPVYAAPELFDGRPSQWSDQYSLAIVFQELLTGVLPFKGRTTAQLASQHLHARPRVDVLPATDQTTIIRALAKDPTQRFACCREMIDRLVDPRTDYRPRPALSTGPSGETDTTAVKTEILAAAGSAGTAAGQSGTSQRARVSLPAAVARDLPPLAPPADPVEFRPTLVIGIGGLAAESLLALQRRIIDRFGGGEPLPALQLLLIDTDSETLRRATEDTQSGLLANDATLLLPLRAPTDYRREAAARLTWLSRRWIYNIPRSLKTEGFRPLGRLALTDHAERVTARLKRALHSATDAHAVEFSREQSGLNFVSGPPRVFVVASMSGGTGSGMVLDVGYLIRHLLGTGKYDDASLCGVLAHCAGRSARSRELAVANAYSCLVELGNYSATRGGYPGDACLKLESPASGTSPFDTTYAVRLGEDLDQPSFVAGAERIAEFLYQNTLTPAAHGFDRARQDSEPSDTQASSEPTLRTFGLGNLVGSHGVVPRSVVDAVCHQVLNRWKSPPTDPQADAMVSLTNTAALLTSQFAAALSEDELLQEVTRRCTEAGLDLNVSAPAMHDLATAELGSDPACYLQNVLEELVANFRDRVGDAGKLPPAALILETIDSLFHAAGGARSNRVCLESALDAHLKQRSAENSTELQNWILSLVASPHHRVVGTLKAADCLTYHLRQLSRQVHDVLAPTRLERQHLEKQLRESAESRGDLLGYRGVVWNRRLSPSPSLMHLFDLKINEVSLNAVSGLISRVIANLAETGDRLRNLSADLDRLSDEFRISASEIPTGRETVVLDEPPTVIEGCDVGDLASAYEIGEQELATLDALTANELERLVHRDPGYVRRGLPQVLRQIVSTALVRLAKHQALQELVVSWTSAGAVPDALVATAQRALANHASWGGDRRLFFIAPREVLDLPDAEKPLGDFTQPSTPIVNDEADIVVCCETDHVSLQRVAASILDGRFDQAEIASRFHTRIDVTWSPL